MILTPTQVSEILKEVDKHTLLFIAGNVGVDTLSLLDRLLLRGFGINANKLYSEFPFYVQSFYFGRLSQLLGEKNTSQLSYKDLRDYLYEHQYQPLTQLEISTLEIAKKKTYGHIKDLGSRQKGSINEFISREEYEKLIGDTIGEAISKRKMASSIVSEIGKKTGDWQRDLGRIAETEMQNAYNYGRLNQIIKEHGDEVWVYKQTYPGACRHCIRLHLTGGIGSKPILFRPSELVANGSNIGRKVADWKATIDSEHPWCRCEILIVFPGQVWDEDKNMFVWSEKFERKVERKSKVRVKVGSKEFLV